MNYWQIGSGDSDRDYSNVFFDFGVALVGPGDYGNFIKNRSEYDFKAPNDIKKIEPLLRMKKGNRIVLRKGRKIILAVGEIIDGQYGYSSLFSDIDGWDLQHYIRVDWRQLEFKFENSILSMSTLEGLDHPEVKNVVEQKWDKSPRKTKKYELSEIPVVEYPKDRLDDEALETFLIEKGFRIIDAENMTRTISRVRKLGMWYLKERGENSSEHEVRTFLIIPFFQSLGWSEQRIGIEVPDGKRKIDIVFYSDSGRKKPIVLIETKKIWTGLEYAYGQIKDYAKKFPTVQYLITTDGLRYTLYQQINGRWEETAYMNFRKMLDRHSCYPNIRGVTYLINQLLSIK